MARQFSLFCVKYLYFSANITNFEIAYIKFAVAQKHFQKCYFCRKNGEKILRICVKYDKIIITIDKIKMGCRLSIYCT